MSFPLCVIPWEKILSRKHELRPLMIIDLHIHTYAGSSCSVLPPDELIMRAKELGLDGVCVTEHNNFIGKRFTGRYDDLVVFSGVEIRSIEGDILVYGLDEIPFGSAQEIIDSSKEQGAAVFIAHPFRSPPFISIGDAIYRLKDFDGIEILNGNCTKEENQEAQNAMKSLHCLGIGGSDAHATGSVGKYVTEFDEVIESEDDFVECLLKGEYSVKNIIFKTDKLYP